MKILIQNLSQNLKKASTIEAGKSAKGSLIAAIFAAILISPMPALSSTPEVKLVSLSPDAVYVPPGFDDNDRAEIVVEGKFRNSCYRAAGSIVKIDHTARKIKIQDQAYIYSGQPCLQMLVPYEKTIALGLLQAGSYEIFFADQADTYHSAGRISASRSTSPQPDDHDYAIMRDAYLKGATGADAKTLVLRGVHTLTCVEIDEVKILRRATDVIEVLPVLKVNPGPCTDDQRGFEDEIVLPVQSGERVLVHIRSMDGKSINRVFQF